MAFAALINPRSGGVPADGVDRFKAACDRLGIDCPVTCAQPDSMEDDMHAAAATARNGLIVWGGDGTIACALNSVGADGPPVLALPGGTMNLLPRSIHGADSGWEPLLDKVIGAPATRPLPAGQVDGRSFYVAVMVGELTRLAGPREAAREGDIVGAARALLSDQVLDLHTSLKFALDEPAGEEQPRTATALGVFLDAQRAGYLEIGAIDPQSLFDLARMGLAAMIDDWRKADGLELLNARRVDIEALDGDTLAATLDGEPVDLPRRAEITRVENAARVLVEAARS